MLRWWTICHSFHRIWCTNKRSDANRTSLPEGLFRKREAWGRQDMQEVLGWLSSRFGDSQSTRQTAATSCIGISAQHLWMWSWNCQKVHKGLPLSLSSLVLFGHEKKIVVLFQDFFQHPGTKNSGQRRLPLFLSFSFAKALFWCSNFVQIPSDLGQPPVGAALQGFENSLRNCVFDVCNGALSHWNICRKTPGCGRKLWYKGNLFERQGNLESPMQRGLFDWQVFKYRMWQGFCDFYHFYLTCIWDNFICAIFEAFVPTSS